MPFSEYFPFRNLLIFKLLLLSTIAEYVNGQASVNGVISNYEIVCDINTSCSNDGPSSSRYYYVAPIDGRLAISGFANPGVINCCGNDYQMICVGSFRKLKAPGNIHTFSAQNTTGYLDCITTGDSIEINFNGSYGTYGYNATVIAEPGNADPEPNGQLEQAIEIFDGNQYEGHLSFGVYQFDYRDDYMFVADKEGTLSLDIQQSESFQINVYRNDGVYTGGASANTSPFTFTNDCMAIGDTVYISFHSGSDCLNYSLQTNFITADFGYDTEPNNTKESAVETADIFGSVGHGSLSPIPPSNLQA